MVFTLCALGSTHVHASCVERSCNILSDKFFNMILRVPNLMLPKLQCTRSCHLCCQCCVQVCHLHLHSSSFVLLCIFVNVFFIHGHGIEIEKSRKCCVSLFTVTLLLNHSRTPHISMCSHVSSEGTAASPTSYSCLDKARLRKLSAKSQSLTLISKSAPHQRLRLSATHLSLPPLQEPLPPLQTARCPM